MPSPRDDVQSSCAVLTLECRCWETPRLQMLNINHNIPGLESGWGPFRISLVPDFPSSLHDHHLKMAEKKKKKDALRSVRSDHIGRWSEPHMATIVWQCVRKCVLDHIEGPPAQMTSSA